MAFTDHCDVFASFQEDGFNRIIGHVRYQRPSMFNYATRAVAENPQQMLCRPIDAHPALAQHGNPLVTIVDPFPLPGTHFGLNFAVQLVDAKIDFHPGNSVNLPPELAPLPEQRLAIGLTLCAGIGCPPRDVVDQLVPPPPQPGQQPPPPDDLIVLPCDRLLCVCLDASAVGGMRFREYWQQWYLEPFIDRIEITDIRPEELESALECVIDTTLRLGFLPQLRFLLEKMTLNLTKSIAIDVQPKPVQPPEVPNNPAIENDDIKAFIDLEVS
jgi:hypothetical protein